MPLGEPVRTEQLSKPELNKRVGDNLLGFPVLGCLRYLKQAKLFDQLQAGRVSVDDDAGMRYGPEKMKAGVLGFLLASGQLKKNGETLNYEIPDNSLVTHENLEASFGAIALVEQIRDDLSGVTLSSLDTVPAGLKKGLVVPLMHALHKEVESSEHSDDRFQDVQKLLDSGNYEAAREFLFELELTDSDYKLNKVSEMLLTHRVNGSYARLAASYISLISNLYPASLSPEQCKFGMLYARDQETNAIASNNLIANITGEPLRSKIAQRGPRLLDLGSGGGVFALNIGLPETMLFDMSEVANGHAQAKFDAVGRGGEIVTAITGDLTNRQALMMARGIGTDYKPDVVTINYIVHDIMGQAQSYADGLDTVRTFLANYRDAFGSTPLFVTESWDVSWDDLSKGGKPFLSLYTFLHAISPQRLISKELFHGLAEMAGFKVEDEITHGKLAVDGVEKDTNQTLMLVAVSTASSLL